MTVLEGGKRGACRCQWRDPGANVITQLEQCRCHWSNAIQVLMHLGYADEPGIVASYASGFLLDLWALGVQCRRDMVAAVRRQWLGTNSGLAKVFGIGRAQLAKIEKGEQ